MNLRVRRVTCESAILTRGSKGPGRAVRRVRRALEMRDAQKKVQEQVELGDVLRGAQRSCGEILGMCVGCRSKLPVVVGDAKIRKRSKLCIVVCGVAPRLAKR